MTPQQTPTGDETSAKRADALARLQALASITARADLARYGIPDANAIGVPMGAIKRLAKEIGRDHALALSLWNGGTYEARTLALHLADPALMTAEVMQCWVTSFDNWAICDTACFQLFDKTADRWTLAGEWCADERLYVRRAGLAMIWAMSMHDKTAPDSRFLAGLGWIDAASTDARDHVRKAADMALRATGRRNDALRATALALCDRLVADADPNRSWLGRTAARELRRAG